MIRDRRTKIVATVGPASTAPAMLRAFLENGAEDYTSMVMTAKSEGAKLLAPKPGDTLVVLCAVPFGENGSTNNIRVVGLD